MPNKFWIDVVGWVGSVEVVVAYAMISSHKMRTDQPIYQWLNLSGAVFLIINTLYYGAYPSMAVNIIWVGIALYGVFHAKIKNQKPQ